MIDSAGAFLSALLLGVVLPYFEEVFGMPPYVLFYLSGIAFVYSVYSFCCYFFDFRNLRLHLRNIIIANLLYCFLTASLVFFYYDSLLALGLIYFVIEIIIVLVLVVFEAAAYIKPSKFAD